MTEKIDYSHKKHYFVSPFNMLLCGLYFPRGGAGDALQFVLVDSLKIRLLNLPQRHNVDNSYLGDMVTIHVGALYIQCIQDVYEADINKHWSRNVIILASYWTRAGEIHLNAVYAMFQQQNNNQAGY
jgi:hypothetical protein